MSVSDTSENDSTGSPGQEAGYGVSDAGQITATTLVIVVVIGLIGVVTIGGVYCARAYCSGSFWRYGRGYKKMEDTDPLLENQPP